MEIYLLKSTVILALLLAFYKLLLEKEDMHVFKRCYLLLSLISAIGIPFISFATYIEGIYQPMEFTQFRTTVEDSSSSESASLSLVEIVLWSSYGVGVLICAIRFGKNLFKLVKRIRQSSKLRSGGVTFILSNEEEVVPHTFFNYIFLSKHRFEANTVPREVMAHEKAHALQRHSWDIIFVELLQIVFWFHPLIYILKKTMKLNHEFLADKAALRSGGSTRQYQRILLSFSSNDFNSRLVHPINYSFIKKRFTVMKTTSSKKTIWCKGLLVLPLLAGLIYSCSTEEIVEKAPASSVQDKSSAETLELSVDKEGIILLGKRELKIGEIQETVNPADYDNFNISASPEAPKDILDNLVQEVLAFSITGSVTVCSTGGEDSGEKNVLDELFVISVEENAASPSASIPEAGELMSPPPPPPAPEYLAKEGAD